MSESEEIKDMSLEDKEKNPKPLDMNLEGPDPIHLGVRISKLFPKMDVIEIGDDLKIMKMSDSSYKLGDKSLKELSTTELEKIDVFLKSKGG